MKAFLYGVALQWKLDIRSKTMLITCYMVPLVFFLFMGGIFTSINPEAKYTLIQSMTVFGVSMGAFIGLPPPLVEIYGSDIKNVYKTNGVPLYMGAATNFISAFIHLMIMSIIIFFTAPVIFKASVPPNLLVYFTSLAVFTCSALGIGSFLGLLIKNSSKLTMLSQIFFLPSIMLSGIMFPIDMLPEALEYFGRIFPSSWGYKSMVNQTFDFMNYVPMIVIFLISIIICGYRLSRIEKK